MEKLKLLLIVLFIGISSNAFAQATPVSGVVVDDQGIALPGANVLEKGTTNGVVTDFDGNFTISVEDANATLSVSYIGFETKEIKLDGSQSYSVQLATASTGLDEVVVIGYGGVKSKDLTGSVKVISSKDFNKGVSNSPGQLLQGKMAGVNVTTSSGEPGSAVDINIRGVSSVGSSSNPLYVVDGVPLDGGSSNSSGLEGVGGTSRSKSPLNFMNPQDIESITVLKDASATAIYGTRASNGVVLIQTKKGKVGKAKVTFSTSTGFSSVARDVDVLSASEYKEQTARLAPLVGRDANDYVDASNANTNWQDEIYQTALMNNYNLGISGGAGTTTYNVSLGYLDQEGVVKTTEHEKVTGRFNVGTSVLDDRLKFQANLTVANLTDESQALGNLITGSLRANPTGAVYGPDGEVTTLAGATDNPVALFDLYRDRAESKKILANFTTTYTIVEGLDYKLNLAYENADTDRMIRVYNNAEDGGSYDTDQIVKNSNEDSNVLIENFLTYSKSYDKWNFDALAGHSYQTFNNTSLRIKGEDFSTYEIDPIYNLGIVDGTTTIQSGDSERKLQSFYGRLNANFLDRYLVTASFRADGSSVFGENNKYGYFPAVGLGWKINEEAFLADSDVFSNLKLRLGWGQTGNQAVPVRVTQASFETSVDNSYTFNGTTVVNGVTSTRTPNPDLKWEVTEQYNIGLDWTILNGKVSGTFDYFNKSTTDLFLQVSSPVPSLTNSIYVNSDAEIINKGYEFALNVNAIRTDDFSLDFSGNISFLDNNIKGLSTDVYVGNISGPGTSGETSSIFTNGQSAGSFYLPRFQGYDSDGVEILSEESEIVGDALPNTIYGFNINASYKAFDLALNFNGVGGVDIFNNTARAYSSAASLGQNGNNIFREYLDVEESPLAAPASSSKYIEDGSFFRLNNATLGWNVKSKSFLDSLRLYLTGQNLFVITDYSGYDPEVNTGGGNVYGVDFGGYPRPRTIILGLDLSF
ncbi:SusC/RagA family TonB-linked outer membrane protein [Maribacter polysiphoniae]|uniref:Iron complex outermembrane receptor protein n=1 Tax=Maribacter polysiphoniae TaxID=429344 RepID=A0A316DU14_9FLAO|nr:SusC/RagA family TonB-linked outer membrane protein [Maribacter polysiphoniae]MBD1262106.1 SusC/RagA family TonB-linked outer membrane protein [Maribacter polysiphoniae]PWK21797.1 iron complex outermembrane receptor protein [Maribacter polysiphoniae]